jgi:hypothetical protein
MQYPNVDAFSSPLALQQPNTWSTLGVAQGNSTMQAWQQAAQQLAAQQLAAQQLAHHQLLAQQLAAQIPYQSLANGQLRTSGQSGSASIGVPLNLVPAAVTLQHIAQSLYALAQQIAQLTGPSSVAGLYGNAQAVQYFAAPLAQQYAPLGQPFASLGQPYGSGLALH